MKMLIACENRSHDWLGSPAARDPQTPIYSSIPLYELCILLPLNTRLKQLAGSLFGEKPRIFALSLYVDLGCQPDCIFLRPRDGPGW